MKRYFTQLLNMPATGKKYRTEAKIFFLGVLLCGMSNVASAAITVTAATGGAGICSNLAMNGSAPAYTTLGVITMTEGANNDFGNTAGTYTVTLTVNTPTGWVFNTGAVPTLGFTAGKDITAVTQLNFTTTALTIQIVGTGRANIDAVTITGLQAEASSTSSAAGNMYATLAPGSIAIGITAGAAGTNFGSLSLNPVPITGANSVCEGGTINLTDATTGGTWGSSSTTLATITGTTVTAGTTAGVVNIDYTVGGCITTYSISVNATPSPISGNTTVCSGTTTTLSNTVAGGRWTSATTTVATVGSASGIVSGVPTVFTTSTSVISYSVAACPSATVTVTVNPTPAAITGPAAVCLNATISLSDPTPGGAWSSSSTTLATVTGGVVTGVGLGTPYISYTITGCSATHTVLVNPIPAAITGTTTVCTGLTTDLSDVTAGGAWSSITTTVATIGTGTGIVTGSTAGTSVIHYKLGTGCLSITTVTVNQTPLAIAGIITVCTGATTTLSDPTVGGTWSSGSSGIATVGSATGIVSGATAGMALIIYQITATGCLNTTTVTVHVSPSAISGATNVCAGLTTTLSNTSLGGTWTSTTTTVATIGSASGVVSALTTVTVTATSVITYSTGCGSAVTATVTVLPLPVPGTISGASSECPDSVVTLSDASVGGVWSSSNTSIATVGSATGVATGVAVGTVNIIYTVSNSACSELATFPLTVGVVTPTVTISANPGLTSCLGVPDTFMATAVNGGTLPTYQWKVNRSIVLSTANPFIYTPNNGDTVICIMTSNAGCLSTNIARDTVVMKVNATLIPSVTISTGAYTDTVCVATLTQFTATPVNGGATPTYLWMVNGASAGATNPFNYTPVNGDTITCKLTSSYSCATPASVMSNTITMTVVTSESPMVNITASANPSCDGYPVTFTAHTLYEGISPFIRWTQNSVNVATGPTYTIVPNNGDQFYCMLESSNSCITSDSVFSNTIFMTVDTAVTPVVTVSAGHTVITTSQYDTLTATVTPASITPTYQWYLNGVAIAGAISSVYVAHISTSGVDNFYCIVGNGNACNTSTISSLITVTVNASTGVNQVLGNDDLKLVPNPNDGEFTIMGTISSDDQDVMLEVTNVVGQVVYKNITPVQNGILNKQISLGKELANGVYLLNVITNNAHKVIRFSLSR